MMSALAENHRIMLKLRAAGIAVIVLSWPVLAWSLPVDTVWIRLTVDTNGTVANAELVQNTGTQWMADAAIKRLRSLHYKPNVVKGRAVASTTTVEITFQKKPPKTPTASPAPH